MPHLIVDSVTLMTIPKTIVQPALSSTIVSPNGDRGGLTTWSTDNQLALYNTTALGMVLKYVKSEIGSGNWCNIILVCRVWRDVALKTFRRMWRHKLISICCELYPIVDIKYKDAVFDNLTNTWYIAGRDILSNNTVKTYIRSTGQYGEHEPRPIMDDNNRLALELPLACIQGHNKDKKVFSVIIISSTVKTPTYKCEQTRIRGVHDVEERVTEFLRTNKHLTLPEYDMSSNYQDPMEMYCKIQLYLLKTMRHMKRNGASGVQVNLSKVYVFAKRRLEGHQYFSLVRGTCICSYCIVHPIPTDVSPDCNSEDGHVITKLTNKSVVSLRKSIPSNRKFGIVISSRLID